MSCPFGMLVRLAPAFAAVVPVAGAFYRQYPKASLAVGGTSACVASVLGYRYFQMAQSSAPTDAAAGTGRDLASEGRTIGRL